MTSLPAQVAIAPMSIADYDEVFGLWQRAEGVGLNESDSRERIASYLKRNPGLSLVARCGPTIVGAILCGHDGRRGYLHHLAIERSYRRQGVGRCLVENCLQRLQELGILKCNISVFDNNGSGELFWNRLGWVTRSDLRVMQKVLA